MENKVVRYYETTLRSLENETDKMLVEGYALKFNQPTQIGSNDWGWIETIAPSAMTTADISNVILNYNHSWDAVVARNTIKSGIGKLELIVDEVGLLIRAELIDTTIGKDLYKSIKSGLINRMSFSTMIQKSEWVDYEEKDKMDERTITEFGRMFDVSAVTFPAYEDTIIEARSNIIDQDAKQHFEKRSKKEDSVEEIKTRILQKKI